MGFVMVTKLTDEEEAEISAKATKKEEAAEKAYDAVRSLPQQGTNTRTAPAVLKRCGLFNANDNRVARDCEHKARSYPVQSGGVVEYFGPELRQDDDDVLAELTHIRESAPPSAQTIGISPYTLLRYLGWATGTKSVTHLRECLDRLTGPTLCYKNAAGETQWKSVFIASINTTEPQWRIALSPMLIDMYQSRATRWRHSVRVELDNGLPSWLYGFVCSHTNQLPYTLAMLQKFSGSTAKKKEFGRQVRKALKRIKAAEGITGYGYERGKIQIQY